MGIPWVKVGAFYKKIFFTGAKFLSLKFKFNACTLRGQKITKSYLYLSSFVE